MRTTEKGVISILSSGSLTLHFQHAPIWLLPLTQEMFLDVHNEQFNSFSELQNHLIYHKLDTALYTTLVSFLGRKLFLFGPWFAKSTNLCLVSGDISFVNEHISQH